MTRQEELRFLYARLRLLNELIMADTSESAWDESANKRLEFHEAQKAKVLEELKALEPEAE